ncbi:hypothetical protein N7462_007648 [Penicillium macrosclerotiorum]|uniref:uncharacterized protein n=1 Tax=Penicillium macrosclerotiorum TaxID=303699 RepID=UPI00254776E2|nr:uncharacterized protein N7462_007648 [Penicillium macrosclerotiorum]KAJ5679404.1 hypothetical protein N7462_007648 [Penicillium macrosclerotiorum]
MAGSTPHQPSAHTADHSASALAIAIVQSTPPGRTNKGKREIDTLELLRQPSGYWWATPVRVKILKAHAGNATVGDAARAWSHAIRTREQATIRHLLWVSWSFLTPLLRKSPSAYSYPVNSQSSHRVLRSHHFPKLQGRVTTGKA